MGGRRIDDHGFWAGGPGKGAVLPDGAKMKQVMSTEGCGELSYYEDTNDTIVNQQSMGVRKAESHDQKKHHRN